MIIMKIKTDCVFNGMIAGHFLDGKDLFKGKETCLVFNENDEKEIYSYILSNNGYSVAIILPEHKEYNGDITYVLSSNNKIQDIVEFHS